MSQSTHRPVDWEQLVKENENRLYRAALAILGDGHEAEDAVQDTFVKYLEKAPAQLENPAAWLMRVLVNGCKSRLRRAERRELPLTDTIPAPEPEERPALERLIKELGAQDYVTLCGAMDAAGVEHEMCTAGIYAMTSASEGFSFVVLEAQSCYLPPVAFDVRVGPPFLISDGTDGFLVPDNDDAAYARRLEQLMCDDELRRAMGKAARMRSLDFSGEKIAQLWYEILGD